MLLRSVLTGVPEYQGNLIQTRIVSAPSTSSSGQGPLILSGSQHGILALFALSLFI